MVRTMISIEEDDKRWLDLKAAEEETSRAALIRTAVHHYRRACEIEARSFQRMLEETSGIWEGEDGLSYQRRLRAEWGDQ